MPRIAIVAGESSGDALAAGLIREARALRGDLVFEGIAGPAMREAGCQPWFRTEDLSVMGLAEVLRHLPRLARIRTATAARLRAAPPAAFVGVDAPDFNLRIAKDLQGSGIPVIQYVCPSVWAWRKGRVNILREACDDVLCLLPFEQEFLRQEGVPGRFVGHPFADEIPAGTGSAPARAGLGIAAARVVAVLPGSRASEVSRLGPVFAATIARVARSIPGTVFVAPMVTPALAEMFGAHVRQFAPDCDVRLISGRARSAMAAADVVLLASGTATLEAMLLERPMVVAYRLAPATWAAVRALRLVRVGHVALPNLLAGSRLVPEYLQGAATPDALASALTGWLDSPQQLAAAMAEFRRLRGALHRGASGLAARAVLEHAGLAQTP